MADLPSIEGPHTPESATAAAEQIAELVRYLIDATLPHRAADALPHPSDVAGLVGHLGTALERMPQLFRQVDQRLGGLSELPLTAAAGEPPTALLDRAGNRLWVAASAVTDVGRILAEARTYLDRIGVEDKRPRYPRFHPDAVLTVDAHNGIEEWTGADWNAYVESAERNMDMVTVRVVACPRPIEPGEMD